MESNHKLKENQIKHCTCYYFDGLTNLEGYRCIISGISKSGAINLMQNIYFTEERGTQKIQKSVIILKRGNDILPFADIEIEKHIF